MVCLPLASRCSDSLEKQNKERQLELAVAWNRVDIAESEIFTEQSQWKVCYSIIMLLLCMHWFFMLIL